MYFKRMEVHGFKSFAEPVVIDFDEGITCVVGPNGSGKSNICDAIRWVLGAQSAKMLRGDKMEDVIFAGTASRKSKGMAEVTLVIDNGTGILPIDYNEVAITRRMYRSGESEYLINNNRCRMKDIRELTMDTGIGVEGYSIIGQGKISDIISNNTDSIREILEETAGIITYRNKKGEAERKLSSASVNMERVGDIIGEIEGRIDGLKEDSEKATEYLSLRERNKGLEINITLKNIETIEIDKEYLKDDLLEIEGELTQVREEKRELLAIEQQRKAEKETLEKATEESRQKQIGILEEISRFQREKQVREEKISSASIQMERLQEEVGQLKEREKQEKEKGYTLEKEKASLDESIRAHQIILEEKTNLKQEKVNQFEKMEQEIDAQKNFLFQSQNKVSNWKGEIRSMEGLLETLNKREEILEGEEEHGDNSLAEKKQKLAEIDEEQKDRKKNIKEGELKREKITTRYNNALLEEKQTLSELEELKVEISRMSSRKKTFEEMAANYEGFSFGVRYLMGKDLSGIHGVVGELFQVPAGFETAIETALGATVQNIICKDEDVAKVAISKLKEDRAGRLTFLPLSSIKPRKVRKESSVATSPGFQGYGVDCIDYDPIYQPVVEFLLGNTVIVDHMENGVNLSRRVGHGMKIVTLEGEVINAGGAITGGRQKHKSANIFERNGEILRLGEDISKREKDKETLTEDISQLGEQLVEIKESLRIQEEQLMIWERESQIKSNEIAVLENSLQDLEEGERKRVRERLLLQEEKGKTLENIEKIQEELNQMLLAHREAEEDILAKTERYNEGKIAKEQAVEEVTSLRMKGNTLIHEKSKIQALLERLEEGIAHLCEEENRKAGEIDQLKEERATLEGYSTKEQLDSEQKEEERENLEIYLKELSEDRKIIGEKIEKEERRRESLEEILNQGLNKKHELELKGAKLDTKLENAKEKLWEEFEVSYLQAMDFKAEEFALSSAVRENRELRSRIKELGEVNVGAIEEYKTVKERYEFLKAQRDDLDASMEELETIISNMDRIIKGKFKQSFNEVVDNFEQVFMELYGGGHAKIALIDPENPLSSEIEIIAQPPGKQLKHINLLSGGEKTMTAIALMFAVLRTKPTPFCILDEVEAALDDSNLEIFGDYVKKFKGVQFTLITHQKATMAHADVMYGVTMPESGVSKMYSLKMDDHIDL